MLFGDKFIATLPDNPVVGAIQAVDTAFAYLRAEGWTQEEYEALLEAFALISGMVEARLLSFEFYEPDLRGNAEEDSPMLYEYLGRVRKDCMEQSSRMRLESLKSHFRTSLGASFAYEFTDGDIARVQDLLNQLRGMVSESNLFEEDHQRRILSRLERLQAEMHKRTADLDRFWGLIGDAGVAIGKFGKDAKPIFDRIREITEIVWRTQARAEELPSSAPPPVLAKPIEDAHTDD